MSSKPILDKALALRRVHPFQQFGQSDDASTFGGSSGCTHACLQYLAKLWKGKWYTQDQVSVMAGYPSAANNPGRRGLRPSEVQQFCNKAGLPYVVKFGLTVQQVRDLSARGPVMFGHAYSWTPEWSGFRYGGITADGKPNGYARPLGAAGKTQLSGFTGAHASVFLGYLTPHYVMEPNHGSPARPERPPYDAMTLEQFTAMYRSYQTVLGRTLYAVVPSRALPL